MKRDTRTKRSPRRVVGAIAIGAALILLVCLLPTHTQPVTPKISRPKRWLNEPTPTQPTSDQVVRFRRRISEAVALEHEPATPYTNHVVVRLIQDAQGQLERAGSPNGTWRGEDVLRIALSFGSSIPLAEAEGTIADDPNLVMASLYGSGVLALKSAKLRERPIEAVAGMLIHEATHVVFKEAFLKESGLSTRQFILLGNECPDTGQMITFVTEALAYGNQQLWCEAVVANARWACVNGNQNVMVAAHDARLGPDHSKPFAQLMLAVVYHNHPNAQQIADTRGCGPVIIQHGSLKDQFLFPSDLAPDFITPLLDSIE